MRLGLAVLLGLGAAALGYHLVLIDLPVYSGTLFLDYPDPASFGHLKGATVSLPELLLKLVGTFTCAVGAVGAYRSWRRQAEQISLPPQS